MKKRAFTLTEVLITQRERGKISLFNLSRTRELIAPYKRFVKQCAFTLAEVLITLGIIGVVAAITIPNLIQESSKQQTLTGLKKAFSIITNTIKRSELDNGEMRSWPVAAEWDTAESKKFWNTYLLPYLSVDKLCSSGHDDCWASNPKYLDGSTAVAPSYELYARLKDGELLHLTQGVTFSYAILDVDINGLTKPNVYGKDIFVILITYPKGKVVFNGDGYSRTDILGDYSNACNKSAGYSKGCWCGKLIQLDGWQIKSDYPWN